MAAEHLSPASVPALVELMYRADWTSLSLELEVAEFDDYEARSRLMASRRPSWLPDSGPFPDRAAGRRTPPGPDHESDPDDDADDGDEDDGEGGFQAQREQAYRLVIAPGGRFRADNSDGHLAGSDGQPGHEALPPCHDLLLPAWLPARFELELASPALVDGRPAHRLIGRPRPVGSGRRSRPGQFQLTPPHRQRAARKLVGIDRIDATLDAELGILLRCELMHRGQLVSRLEITALTAGPPDSSGAARFAAPDKEDQAGRESPFTGPGWERAKTVANAGATALSFVIRHAPHREPPAGSQAGAPPSHPVPDQDAWSRPSAPGSGGPLSGPVIRLLYEAGLRHTAFDAELRTWADTRAAADALRSATRNATLPGVIKLGQTISERATTWQSRDAVRVGLPDMYRIDYIDGGAKRNKVISEACDGSRRLRVFAGHLSAGAARPLPDSVARLADPAWLLEWQLTGGAEITEQGRRAYLLQVRPRWPAPDPEAAHDFDALADAPTEVVLDAESGIVLRLLQEQPGRPSMQQVLAGVSVRAGADPAEFRIRVPPGARVLQDSGTVLDEAALSAPAQAAVTLTVKGLSAAARLGGFLQSMRQSAQDPGAGRR